MAPSDDRSRSGKDGETLREKAAKKLQGPDANPSQLGDPISLKAETSDTIPKPEEGGAGSSSANKDGSPYAPPVAPPPSHDVNWDSNNPGKQRELENKKKMENNKAGSTNGNNNNKKTEKEGGSKNGETLREKAAKKVKGPDANPSQLGDPVSLKNEISQKAPTPTEEGAAPSGGNKKGRESKL